MSLNPWKNQSMVAAAVKPQNFYPQYTVKMTSSGTSQSVTFATVTGTGRQTFKFINTDSANGVYISWGHSTATATAISTTPVINADYIAPGQICVLDLEVVDGVVDTIAIIQETGAAVIYISIGDGQ